MILYLFLNILLCDFNRRFRTHLTQEYNQISRCVSSFRQQTFWTCTNQFYSLASLQRISETEFLDYVMFFIIYNQSTPNLSKYTCNFNSLQFFYERLEEINSEEKSACDENVENSILLKEQKSPPIKICIVLY